MAIQMACPNCGRPLAVPESAVGKQGKCQACGCTFTIPSESATGGREVAPVAAAPKQAAKVEMECPHCGVVVRGLPETFAQPIACPDCKVTDFFEPASPPEQPFWKKMPFRVGAGVAALLVLLLASRAIFFKRTPPPKAPRVTASSQPSEPGKGETTTKSATKTAEVPPAIGMEKKEAESPVASSSGSVAKTTAGEAGKAETKQSITDAKGNKVAPPDTTAPDVSMSFYELSDEESARYTVNKLQKVLVAGRVAPGRGSGLAGVAEFMNVAAQLDVTKASDRERAIREFVRILGADQAKEIGLKVYDSEARVRYIWPKPVETAKVGGPAKPAKADEPQGSATANARPPRPPEPAKAATLEPEGAQKTSASPQGLMAAVQKENQFYLVVTLPKGELGGCRLAVVYVTPKSGKRPQDALLMPAGNLAGALKETEEVAGKLGIEHVTMNCTFSNGRFAVCKSANSRGKSGYLVAANVSDRTGTSGVIGFCLVYLDPSAWVVDAGQNQIELPLEIALKVVSYPASCKLHVLLVNGEGDIQAAAATEFTRP
jgi:hypothetical protein